ncbi:MAG: rod shape-determining protein RodA [Candidatus Omnitrophica bacterium]|nr:rod shape-determining protein RodA [Candidatus Omnitrophota bacterium]
MIKLFKDNHWPIFFLTTSLTISSFFFIYSATFRGSENYMYKQLFWFALAIFSYWLMIMIGYRKLLNLSTILYWFSVVVLGLVLFVGHTRHGAQRWLPLGPLALQPSEFCKLATILMLSQFLAERVKEYGQIKSFLIGVFLIAIPFVLIFKQPDLGTALIFIPMLLGMLFAWGIRLRYLLAVFSSGLLSTPLLWFMLKPYQQKRLLVFLNPNVDPLGSGYTAIQSKIAVGSGGLIGKGWLHGTQTQLDFVPEHHTDFIFCVVGEEFGFLGSLLLILLFACLVGYFIQIMQHTTDVRARVLAAGIISIFFFQVVVNIGMTVGLAPIVGVTLPLISYGGSSLIATYIAIGLLVSIHRERSIF